MSDFTVCKKCGIAVHIHSAAKHAGMCVFCFAEARLAEARLQAKEQANESVECRPAVPIEEVADPYPASLVAASAGQEESSAEAEGAGEAGDHEGGRVACDENACPYKDILHDVCGKVRSMEQLVLAHDDKLKEREGE